MSWRDLRADVLAEFAHYEHGVAFLTNGGRELPYVVTRFPHEVCSPGQQWLDGDEADRAAVAASLERPRPVEVRVALEEARRTGRGPGRLAGDPPPPVAWIRRLAAAGLSNREIERRTGVGRNRIARVLR